MSQNNNMEVAVLIGRFQPFHHGHAALLRLALDTAPKVLVVLGSSFHARSTKNPFTWQERAAMIAGTVPEKERDRISFVAIRDYYEDMRWAAKIKKEVEAHASSPQKIALIGHFKDATSYYLHLFSQWQLVAANNLDDIDATSVRQIMFEAENMAVSMEVIAQHVPLSIRQYLKAWSLLPAFAPLKEEYKKLEAYKKAWSAAPYAPIFSTVDAVVKTGESVLLVQRGGFPGRGLWAIPGGFLDQRERLIQGAIRELQEETNLAVLSSTLENALVDVKVFDHPDRSLRGRTVTHAHFFDLKLAQLPEIAAADDAAHAAWIPIENLSSMEEVFFDDHFHILDHFLKLTEA